MAIFTETWKLDIFVIIIGLLTLATLTIVWIYTYWDRKRFKTLPGLNYLFGHFKTTFLQQEFAADCFKRFYNATNEPFIGLYTILSPILFIRDPELIRAILVKDFQTFSDRGIHCNENYDPMTGNLFALPFHKWKNLRSKLTPTFTSSKLKSMFTTLLDCGKNLQSHLDSLLNKNELLDLREISVCHATNVIASIAFGIEVDSITNPENEFRACGRKMFESSFMNAIRLILNFIAPKMMSILRIKLLDDSVENFIRNVVKENLEYRETNNFIRKDFFQLLIQLRNTGKVRVDGNWETTIRTDESQKLMSLDEISAQVFVFFAAGFETSSITLIYCLFELAKHSDIQNRVLDEIDTVLDKYDGQITYEAIADMKYLDKCIDETLRKYPILPVLNRTCMKDYIIPGTNKVIPKGIEVFINVLALHRDEKYYPNPMKFDPERFSEENLSEKNTTSALYIPFGDGPRNCIGLRLGKLQNKVAVVMMLQNHRFECEDKGKDFEVKFNPQLFLLVPLTKIYLKVFNQLNCTC